MTSSRNRAYADLLLDTCLGVQSGWQVLVVGTPQARPLLEELIGGLARRDAYALPRVTFTGRVSLQDLGWALEAPLERLARPAPLEVEALRTCDAIVAVDAPENTRAVAALAPERMQALQGAYRPALGRVMSHEVPWVGCQYPTPALAQDAGMGTAAFAEFLYAACLRDWESERERMRRHADRFDGADEVRIVGAGTDLRLGLEGRAMKVDAAGSNMPGGEFFGCPVEGTTSGVIVFSEFPATFAGRDIAGVRLRFEDGVVVDASAETNEEFLLETLDRDAGARRLGELGVGCNPGITRYMRNTLFDEKMDGTVHIALGNSYHDLGGTNVSSIHWDIVKDLRHGGRIELDGVVVQQDGAWLAG
ncbi:MAG: aminopeptidase [Gaiellaceae bacterium]